MKARKVLVLMAVLTAMTVCGCGQKDEAPENGTEIAAITDTEEPTEAPAETGETEDTEGLQIEAEVTDTEEVATSQDSVKEMSAVKYAKSTVNVRKGPSADTEKIGGLSTNQKVTVTGQADNGWYRIDFNGETGFVSDQYLTDEKVNAAASGNTASAGTPGNAGNKTDNGNAGTAGQGNDGNTASAGSTDGQNAASSGNNGGNGGSGNAVNAGNGNADAGNTDTGNNGNTDTASGTTDNAEQPDWPVYENSSSGKTYYGDQAQQLIESGALEIPGVIYDPETGSITLP